MEKLQQSYLFIPSKYKDCYLVSVLNELAGNSVMVFCGTCSNAQRCPFICSSQNMAHIHALILYTYSTSMCTRTPTLSIHLFSRLPMQNCHFAKTSWLSSYPPSWENATGMTEALTHNHAHPLALNHPGKEAGCSQHVQKQGTIHLGVHRRGKQRAGHPSCGYGHQL